MGSKPAARKLARLEFQSSNLDRKLELKVFGFRPQHVKRHYLTERSNLGCSLSDHNMLKSMGSNPAARNLSRLDFQVSNGSKTRIWGVWLETKYREASVRTPPPATCLDSNSKFRPWSKTRISYSETMLKHICPGPLTWFHVCMPRVVALFASDYYNCWHTCY